MRPVGNLIYEVTIANTDIGVDAGNGKVLYTESAHSPDRDEHETPYPRSSIQISPRVQHL